MRRRKETLDPDHQVFVKYLMERLQPMFEVKQARSRKSRNFSLYWANDEVCSFTITSRKKKKERSRLPAIDTFFGERYSINSKGGIQGMYGKKVANLHDPDASELFAQFILEEYEKKLEQLVQACTSGLKSSQTKIKNIHRLKTSKLSAREELEKGGDHDLT